MSVKLKLESPWDLVVQSIRPVEKVLCCLLHQAAELTHDRALLEVECGILLVREVPRIWAVRSVVVSWCLHFPIGWTIDDEYTLSSG